MIKGEKICDIVSAFLVCKNNDCNHEEEVYVTDKPYLDYLYSTEKHRWTSLSKYKDNWKCSKCSFDQYDGKVGKLIMPATSESLDFHIKSSGGLLEEVNN